MQNYNFIDLFCGCGGFSKGLEKAGHRCLLGIDFDKHAVETFRLNHRNAKALQADISEVSEEEIKELIGENSIDMVVGGPPCQGFSTVGKGLVEDKRNGLFKHFIRIVKILRPKIVLFENVTGLLASKNASVLQNIFSEFQRLGFNMDAQVLDASHYGVPSRRRRTILMGVRNDLPLYPERTLKLVTVKKTLLKIQRLKSPQNHDVEEAKIKKAIDEQRIKFIPPGHGIRYERDEEKFLPSSLRYEVDWKTVSEGRFRQTRLQRLPLNSPAPTILTGRYTYYHPTENRFLTVREASSLQSFPSTFKFLGPISSQFRQIGNAVPPALAYHIGESIKKIKFDKNISSHRVERNLSKLAFHYKNRTETHA